MYKKSNKFARFGSTAAFFGKSGSSKYSKHLIFGLLGGVTAGVIIYSQSKPLHASSLKLDPPHYPWSHRMPWQAFDHASIRRGHQVYNQVCAACHSLNLIAFRNLVDVCYTEEEVKEIAKEFDYPDLDDDGYKTEREGKLTDYFPAPYENVRQARQANNGAKPPDLSLIVKARHDGENYLFALLTGYKTPPAGVTMRQGLGYNPYFPGGAIAMPQALQPGMLDYGDGTPVTISQLAKDVSTFLCWTAEPEHDDRKRAFIKVIMVSALLSIPLAFYKRFSWALLKTQVVRFPTKNFYLYQGNLPRNKLKK